MEIVVLIVVVAVIGFVLMGRNRDFDDPKPMSNQHLLSAIAGQADWLEKMSRAPIESQNNSSIAEIARKRRGYIARLCLEVISRGINGPSSDEPKYPGATVAPNVFEEVVEHSKALEATRRRLLWIVPSAIVFVTGLVAWDLFLLPSLVE